MDAAEIQEIGCSEDTPPNTTMTFILFIKSRTSVS